MSKIAGNAEIPVSNQHPQNCRANSGPDTVGYLKYIISEIIEQSANQKSENGADILNKESDNDSRDYNRNGNLAHNGSNLTGIGCLFRGGVGGGLAETEKERLKGYLNDSVQLISREVDELTEQVLQVCRMRTSLKRKRSRSVVSSKNEETGKANKKQRMLFLARSEAAHRRRMMDVFRECGSIIKQIMQHKWCWPFTQPVDALALGLSNYYDVIERPMDLRTILDRMEANDGSGYSNVCEICEDVRLVFRNAMTYNQQGTDVHKNAKALLDKFEEKWRSELEPKLIELEVIREEEQGCSAIGALNSEITVKQYSDKVGQKLSNIEQTLEEFIRATTSKCRPMSMMEKEELVCRIGQLPPNGLNRIIDIIAQEKTSLDVSAEEIPVDLDKADPATLWRLHFYLQTVASASRSVDKG